MRHSFATTILIACCIVLLPNVSAQTWTFAVSGDSRNCGDVVMPAIAKGAHAGHAAFYWHLGDFRAIYDFDQDFRQTAGPNLTIAQYEEGAWPDFIQNQLVPFGDLPVFLGIGNHELIAPHTRAGFVQQFADWLGAPAITAQRLQDDPTDHLLKTYYHWIQGGVDFISLDNASEDQFDEAQMAWFKKVLKNAASNPAIKSLVVGMHAAFPDSISAGHSMNDSAQGEVSGREAYKALVDFRAQTKKRVYVMASHSHFYIGNVYNTACRQTQKQDVLPGSIVGTAGAVRYRLPKDVSGATNPQTDVYGYVLGTVAADGNISLEFRPVSEKDVPQSVKDRYSPDFVKKCFAENRSKSQPDGPVQPPNCPR